MRGYVPTPEHVVDLMVDKLFDQAEPQPDDRLLDPGCGPGAFISGVLRWCQRRGVTPPRIHGVELDPTRFAAARERFSSVEAVTISRSDFLSSPRSSYRYVIGNPPYVPITGLAEAEKVRYRAEFSTARGRFDLYMLFFEQALMQLAPEGRLVFITPEKYMYVETTRALRQLLASSGVREVHLLPEDTFAPLITYPAVTTVDLGREQRDIRVIRRDQSIITVSPSDRGDSLMPQIQGSTNDILSGRTLEDLCIRVSAGVATGADKAFVFPRAKVSPALRLFARPTLSGRQLLGQQEPLVCRDVMLLPYSSGGVLRPLAELGALQDYLTAPEVRKRLEDRTCAKRKPWYAFHETPPLPDILRPKILCKDITADVRFWADEVGDIVPGHTVYYIVPRVAELLPALLDYLNSPEANSWLRSNCHRAANGYLRLQSSVLRRLPVPERLLAENPHARIARAS